MKVLILYRPNSEHATLVESFVRDFQQQHDVDKKLELVSVNSRDGAATAALYDIWSFPSILVISENGSVMNSWEGEPLPLMDEVAGYLHA